MTLLGEKESGEKWCYDIVHYSKYILGYEKLKTEEGGVKNLWRHIERG